MVAKLPERSEKKKLPLVGSFFLLFAILPFPIISLTGYSEHDAQRLSQWGICAVAALYALLVGAAMPRRWLLLSVFLLLFGALGHRWALIEANHLVLLFALFFVWSGLIRDRQQHLLAVLYAGVSAAYLVVVLPRWVAVIVEGLPFHSQEFFYGFSNQRFFGHWVTLSLPVMVHVRSRLAHKYCPGWLLDLVIGIWVAFGLASGTRGTWVALTIGGGAVALVGAQGRALAGQLIRSVCVGGFAYVVMFVILPWLTGSVHVGAPGVGRVLEGAHFSGRGVLWAFALNGIQDHPWLGNGPMSYASSDDVYARHPHNLLLQVAYEWGIPVALALAIWIARVLMKQVRIVQNSSDDGLRIALLAALIGGLAQAQVDGIFVMPFTQVCFVYLCALLFSIDEVEVLPPSTEGRFFIRARILPLGFLVLVWGQLILMWPELSRFSAWELESLEATGVPMYQPRYWLQGVIFP